MSLSPSSRMIQSVTLAGTSICDRASSRIHIPSGIMPPLVIGPSHLRDEFDPVRRRLVRKSNVVWKTGLLAREVGFVRADTEDVLAPYRGGVVAVGDPKAAIDVGLGP